MAMPPRTRMALDERREQLMALGVTLFTDSPYESVSIDDIAAAAGISKGLLYHYFPSKRAFYVAVVRHAAGRMRSIATPDPDLAPFERLQGSLDAYLDYIEERSHGFRALIGGAFAADEELRAIIEDAREAMFQLVASEIPLHGPLTPVLRLSLRGWIAYAETVSLDWLERRALPRRQVRELLTYALAGAVGAAAQSDPEIELDPAAFTAT